MKKILKFLTALLLAVSIVMLPTACSGGSLAAPGGVSIDDYDQLTWTAVPDARSYDLEIVNVEGAEEAVTANLHRTNYSLSELTGGEDYEIRLRAVGGAKNNVFSDWTQWYSFHREFETGILYTLINNNTEYSVRSVGTASGDVVVPAVYRNKSVTEIGKAAFRGNRMTESVTLPETIRTIGENAFYNCVGLKTVKLPQTLSTLGQGAFYGCIKLTEIDLPDPIQYIDKSTFTNCRELKAVHFGKELLYIGEAAFASCSALEEVAFPDSLVMIDEDAFSVDSKLRSVTFGTGIQWIGESAFYSDPELEEIAFPALSYPLYLQAEAFRNCTKLSSVTLPEKLASIGDAAFYQCTSLASVEIPESVTDIGTSAFAGTAIEQSQAGQDLVYVGDWLIAASQEFVSSVTEIGEGTENAFREGTVGIADQAFLLYATTAGGTITGSPNLTKIVLPESVKYIGSYAFYSSPTLKQLWSLHPNSLVSIGVGAFQDCVLLDNVHFSSGLKAIGAQAFAGCTFLRNNINNPQWLIPSTVEQIGAQAFTNAGLWMDSADGLVYAANWFVGYDDSKVGQTNVAFREDTVGVADYAFEGFEALMGVQQMGNVRYLGRGAFSGCLRLSSVDLGDNLREIKPYTFYNCNMLSQLTVPLYLTSIGDCAFTNCQLLLSLDFAGTDLETIGEFAFYGAFNLRSVRLGEKLRSIGRYAFYGAIQLGSLSVPETVTQIGERAFALCISMTDLELHEGLETIGDYAFRECLSLGAIDIPASVKTIGNYAFYNCASAETLTLREGLETVGNYAFRGCASLKETAIPASVRSVGNYAFKGCSALTEVILLGTPGYIGKNAFYGCDRLTFYAKEKAGEGWNGGWNSSQRPVFWETEFSEEGFVLSVTTGKIANPFARYGVADPIREGYDFLGWARDPDAKEAEYRAGEVGLVEPGVTLYAVWAEKAE